ncbi:MAG: hypothetical protein AAGU32_01060 [Bacillota bacterium]
MQDNIMAGTGNSRYLKSVSNFMSLYPTYADFVAALVAGTLPIDLNGINAAGWAQVGTALNKANLLTDATAALINTLTSTTPSTVNAALSAITSKTQTLWNGRVQIATGSYTGTGTYGSANKRSLTFAAPPKFVVVYKINETSYPFRPQAGYWDRGFMWFLNQPRVSISTETRFVETSVSGNTFSYYSTSFADDQCNASGVTYYYFALLL